MVGEADAEIYQQHAAELTRFASGLVGPTDAADLVSDAVLNALSSPAWPGVSNHRAYLYRAVLNAARARARRDERRRDREHRMVLSEPHGHAHLLLASVDDRDDVIRAALNLSPRQRAVIYLAYWEDITPAASAALLGISEGAIRRHLARARRHLRRTLDEH
jgi:RNA polymerase sigma factor (sigma-70 family)